MYLYEKYAYSLFEARFKDYGRLDNFSYQGLRALYEFLIDIAESTGEPIEVDVIALCCEFSEDTAENVLSYYNACEDIADLQTHTWAIELDNGNILYEVF